MKSFLFTFVLLAASISYGWKLTRKCDVPKCPGCGVVCEIDNQKWTMKPIDCSNMGFSVMNDCAAVLDSCFESLSKTKLSVDSLTDDYVHDECPRYKPNKGDAGSGGKSQP